VSSLEQTLITLIQKFPLLSKQEKQQLINALAGWEDKQKETLQTALIHALNKFHHSQKKALEAFEGFQHQKLTPLFQKKELENTEKEKPNLNSILNQL